MVATAIRQSALTVVLLKLLVLLVLPLLLFRRCKAVTQLPVAEAGGLGMGCCDVAVRVATADCCAPTGLVALRVPVCVGQRCWRFVVSLWTTPRR